MCAFWCVNPLDSFKHTVVSYFDGGSYFAKSDVKQCWESKKFHPKKAYSKEKQIGSWN